MADLPALFAGVLGHRFADEGLLRSALTHRSVGGLNNERLEFLGDSILNFVVAAELFNRYPKASEGDLSRIRASMVDKDSLAQIGAELSLGDHLYLGSGELKSGGFRRKSIIADAVEALIGAVYLDGGFGAARESVMRLYRPILDRPIDPEGLKDPKTRLQELLQARKQALPDYDLVEVSGKPHAQRFTVRCVIDGLDERILGTGKSRRKAEQRAAECAINLLTSGG